jgi:bifunctional pyridoxal-dependent enzyme with beta-cystathionase and maltose regulon repressor activities
MFRRLLRRLDTMFLKRLVVQQRDNRMVAVILGYGGWSSINKHNRHMLFDYTLATLLDVEQDKRNYDAINAYIHTKYPHARYNSAESLYLRWVPECTEFVIGMEVVNGIGGSEFVIYRDDNDWIRA